MLMQLLLNYPLLNFSRMVRPNARGRGRGANAPPPPDYMAGFVQQTQMNQQFMAGMMTRMENLNNNNNNNQQAGPVTLNSFVRLNPATFHNPVEPMDADDWLRDIAFALRSANVAEANYVTFAAYHLRGPAAQWWDSHTRMLPAETVVTWIQFQTAFRARYISQGTIEKKKREFRNLTQGKKTVEAYQKEFLDLSRYAEEDVPTDARKQ